MSIPIFSHAKKKKGFTLAELMVVILIIMILFGVGAPSVIKAQREARQLELDSKAETIYVAIQNRLSNMKVTGLSSVYQYMGDEYEFDQKANGVGKIEGVPSDVEEGVDKVDDNSICYFTSEDLNNENSTARMVMSKDVVDSELRKGNWVVEYNPTSAIVYSVFYSENKVNAAKDYVNNYDDYDAKYRYRQARIDDGAYIGYFGGGSARSNSSKDRLLVKLNVKNWEKLEAVITCNIPDSVEGSDYPVIVLDMVDEFGNTFTKYFHYQDMSSSYLDKIKTSKKIDNQKWLSNKETYSKLDITNNQIQITFALDDLSSENTRFAKKFSTIFDNAFVNGAGSKLSLKASALVPGNNLIVTGYSQRVETNSLFADESQGDTAVVKCARHLQNLDKNSNVNSSIKKVIQTSDITLKESDITYFKPIDNPNLTSYTGSANGIKNKLVEFKINTNTNTAGLFGTISQNMAFKDVTLVGFDVKSSGSSSAAGSLIGRINKGSVTLENVESYLTPVLVADKTNQDVWISAKDSAGGLIGELAGGSVEINNSSASTVIGSYTYKSSADDITITNFNTNSVGGLIGRVSKGSAALDKTYSDSYLVGVTAGGLIGNASKDNIDISISNSYAAGFVSYDTRSAGIVLGNANINNSYTVIDRLYMGNKDRMYYRVSMSGDNDKVFYVTDNIGTNVTSGEKSLKRNGKLLDDLNSNGTVFTGNISYNVAYSLMDLISPNYSYPTIVDLSHRGDSRADISSFVYYEEYSDGTYGFYSPGFKSTLNNDPNIDVVGDGYGLVYPMNEDRKVSLQIESRNLDYESGDLTITNPYQVSSSDGFYYIYPLPTSIVNNSNFASVNNPYYFLKASITTDESTSYYFFNPYFGKTVIEAEYDSTYEDIDFNEDGDVISIRSARHLNNLSKYYDVYANQTSSCVFNQERNIDYTTYDWKNYAQSSKVISQAPIGAKDQQFIATYNGGYNHIYGINFVSENQNYVGMFGQVSSVGTLKNIVLRSNYQEGSKDNNYVLHTNSISNKTVYLGTLVGLNNGNIINCSSDGYYLGGEKGTIQAYENSYVYAGGLVGLNAGTISNSVSDLALMQLSSTYANVKMGGLVGSNLGTIKDSYSIGDLKVTFGKGGNITVGGFSGENRGSISNAYCLTSISGAGDTTHTYGFSPIGGGFSNCEYLYGGSYYFLGDMHSYDVKQSGSAIKGKNYPALSIIDKTDVRKASSSYLYGNLTVSENKYPFVAVLKDAKGNYVHYGDWIKEEIMGSVGVFYWEKEENGLNNGYHFTFLGLDEDGKSFGDSNLCNEHDDGGVISEYGYGYFEEVKGTISRIEVTDGYINGSTIYNANSTNKAYNQIASEELTKQSPIVKDSDGNSVHKYNFYAFTTRNYTSSDKSGITLSSTKPNSTWKLVSVTNNKTYSYYISPFFANALSDNNGNDINITSNDGNKYNYSNKQQVGASINNPYEIRSVDQLQFMNFNGANSSINNNVNGNNYRDFNYLMYTRFASTTGKQKESNANNNTKYTFVQSHDLKQLNSDAQFYPIGAAGTTSSTGGYDAILLSWFGGVYDGQSYKIENINIDSKSYTVGLFGTTAGAKLKNIILHGDGNSTISRTTTTSDPAGGYGLGGLVGLAYDYVEVKNNALVSDGVASIENCSISGYRIVDNSNNRQTRGESNIGGLVGISAVNFDRCSAIVDIKLNFNNTQNGGGMYTRAGGLTGASQGIISNCYTGGSIQVSDATKNYGKNSGSYQLHVAGVAGSSFGFNYKNFTGMTNAIDGSIVFNNCYTYMELPKLEGNIRSVSIMGSQADRYGGAPEWASTTINNCYYLLGIVDESNSANANRGNNGSLGLVANVPNVDSVINSQYLKQGSPFTGLTYWQAMLKGNMVYASLSLNSMQYKMVPHTNNYRPIEKLVDERTILKGGPNNQGITGLTYEQMSGLADIDFGSSTKSFVEALNTNGEVFDWVTTKEGNATIDGKYSFPSMSCLEGKNYPFAAVITQKDILRNRNVYVHYGRWPMNYPYWENGRDTLDIFTNLRILNSSEMPDGTSGEEVVSSKVFKLYTNGLDFGTLSEDNLSSSDIVQIVPGTLQTDTDGSRYYPITFVPLKTGVSTIKFNGVGSDGETYNDISFTLEVSANLYIETDVNALNINQNGSNKSFSPKLQIDGIDGTKVDATLNGKWSIESNSDIVKLSNDSTTFVDSLTDLEQISTVYVKRVSLGSTMVNTNFEYQYKLKELNSEGKYVDILDANNNPKTIELSASSAFVDIVQDDYIGLSNKVKFNVAYFVENQSNVEGIDGEYYSAIPALSPTDNSDFFFYLGKERDFANYSFEDGANINLLINNVAPTKEGNKYQYVIGDDTYYVSLNPVSQDTYYKYQPFSIYCVTQDEEFNLANTKNVTLKAIIKNGTSSYVLQTTLDVEVKRLVNITYGDDLENPISILTGDYLPDTSKAIAPAYKQLVKWVKTSGGNNTEIAIGNLDYVSADTNYTPVYDFIKPVLYANGGEFSDFRNRIEIEMNDQSNGSFDLSNFVPVKDKYRLLGWAKEENATTPTYGVDATVNLNDLNSDYCLYAVWKNSFTNLSLMIDDINAYPLEALFNLGSEALTYDTGLGLTIDDKTIVGWKLQDSDITIIEVNESNLVLVPGVTGYTDQEGKWICEDETLTLVPIFETN